MTGYEQLTEDQWIERFGGYVCEGYEEEGSTRWDEYRHVILLNDHHREGRLWTVIEGEDSAEYLLPGYHYVNRTGFVVSVLPYGDFEGEAQYMEPQCSECREFIDFGTEYGMCDSCIHDAIRSGWQPGSPKRTNE